MYSHSMKVTIFTTPTCNFCKMTKEFLKKHSVEYTEKDVASDNEAAQEMVDLSGQMGVPVTLIEQDAKEGEEESEKAAIIGFDEKKLKELLDIKDD